MSDSTNPYSELFWAISFAAEQHRDQRRKDVHATPYINHCLALVQVLVNDGDVTDSEILMAAVLHDTVEDTETTLAQLESNFGKRVAAIVFEVTDDKSLPTEMRKQLQIEHAATSSPAAKLVKLADKICNVRDLIVSPPVGWSYERQDAYFDWATAVVAGLRGVNKKLETLFDRIIGRRYEKYFPARNTAHLDPEFPDWLSLIHDLLVVCGSHSQNRLSNGPLRIDHLIALIKSSTPRFADLISETIDQSLFVGYAEGSSRRDHYGWMFSGRFLLEVFVDTADRLQGIRLLISDTETDGIPYPLKPLSKDRPGMMRYLLAGKPVPVIEID